MVPVADAQGREDYLRLLAQVPEAVGFVEAHARGQMERGVVVPEPSMDAVVGVVRANTAPFDDGPFPVALVRLGAQREETDAEGDAAAFLAEAARIVEGEINPALERLAAFLDGEYRQAAPAEVGLSRQPGGEAAYRYLVRGDYIPKLTGGWPLWVPPRTGNQYIPVSIKKQSHHLAGYWGFFAPSGRLPYFSPNDPNEPGVAFHGPHGIACDTEVPALGTRNVPNLLVSQAVLLTRTLAKGAPLHLSATVRLRGRPERP